MKVTRRRMHPRTHHAATAAPAEGPGIAPEDEVSVANRRRMVPVWSDADGARHLLVHFGTTAVAFERDEHAFGERLLEARPFVAKQATAWFGDAPRAWADVKPMLDALRAEGILRGKGDAPPTCEETTVDAREGDPPAAARTWSMAEGNCPALTAELTGIPLEIGHLEVVVPVYRIAHPALDTEGRQVGEREVTPRFLSLERPTELRACPYAGSRHLDEKPMNTTALKLMMKRWDHVLALTAQMRDRIVARSRQRGPRWRLGDLHVLAVAALAAPAYAMVRGERPVSNGALDASLSTLFKVVDGVRIVTLTLLLDPDQTATFDTAVTADEVFDVSERLALFLGPHGVCAGPEARIREFLRVLMNGDSVACPGESLDALVGDVDSAIDYALAATQLECVVRSFLDRQHAAVVRIRELLRGHDGGDALRALDAALARAASAPAPLRTPRSAAFHAALFEEAGRAWTPRSPSFEGSLASVLGDCEAHVARVAALGRALPGLPAEAVARIDAYFADERATLGVVRAHEDVVADLLRRPRPAPLAGEALQGHGRLAGADLGAALADAFGLAVTRDAASTRLRGAFGELVLERETKN